MRLLIQTGGGAEWSAMPRETHKHTQTGGEGETNTGNTRKGENR